MFLKIYLLLITCIFTQSLMAVEAIYDYKHLVHPVVAQNGMVSSQEAVATNVGLEILKDGGNAVDAAIATAYALTVTLPRAGNITGGGFMLIYLAEENRSVFIDFREKAPKAATRDMFLNAKGDVDATKARFSVLSVGVPGTVAGLELARSKYGTKPHDELVKPAYLLAKKGIKVTADLHDSLRQASTQLLKDKSATKIFYAAYGKPPEVGETLEQKELAKTLKLLMKKGPESFYKGKIADQIVAYMQDEGGLITYDDLRSYKAVERTPIKTTFKGYTVYTAPPPSSGGILLSQLLYQIDKYPIKKWGANSAKTIHVMTELMKLSYADRAKWLGDTDFVPVPVNALISEDYLDERRQRISMTTRTPSLKIEPGLSLLDMPEHNDTTHFSVVDRFGNAVAVTYTLNFSYGNRQMIPGTGLFLNNEMDDFVSKAGIPNAYGLVGSKFNEIAPEKRMLSSMTPTILSKDNRFFMVTGSPGGSRIISTTFQLILNVIAHDMTVAEATYAPRIHHQWLPDILFIERGISPDTKDLLQKKGHKLQETRGMGSTHSIVFKNGRLYGSSDPRKPGALSAGY